MNILFEGLGNLSCAEIALNKLVIFTGESNSGKTYLNYALYALLDQRYSFGDSHYFESLAHQVTEQGILNLSLKEVLENEAPKLLAAFEKRFAKSMPRFFSAPAQQFAQFKLHLDAHALFDYEILLAKPFEQTLTVGKGDELCEIIKKPNEDTIAIVVQDRKNAPREVFSDFLERNFSRFLMSNLFRNAFILPSERSGLNLFYQELNSQRNSLINHLQKSKINPLDVIQDLIISKYPQPIADYIEFLNETAYLKNEKSDLCELTQYLHKKIVGGRYKVDKDGIQFLPYKSSSKGKAYHKNLDLHLSSSTVKTLFSLDFYLNHMAQVGDVVIVDEPELNLHPDNQRRLARLLVRMVNAGVQVVMSTHSDYIIREINSLIMLSEEFEGRDQMMAKYGYEMSDLLNMEDVSPYLVKDGIVSELTRNSTEGIISVSFDEVINELNQSSDDIYFTKLDQLEAEDD